MLRVLAVVTCITIGLPVYAQNSAIAGDYVGMLGPSHVKLHLVADPSSKLTCTADNSDAGIVGMPCEDIRADSQTLSFKVPMVQGTWTGFVGADHNSLSGMWGQAGLPNPMPLNFTRSSGSEALAGASTPGEVKWDDYVFRLINGGQMVQVYQGGKMVGSIMTVNGQLRVVALPGTDSAKLQKSYQDYQTFNARSRGDAPPVTATAATAATVAVPAVPTAPAAAPAAEAKSLGFSNDGKADPTGIKFEGKTVTVPRTDGMVVTFMGEDVTIGGPNGPMYVLRHKKGSVGRALEQTFDKRNAVGGGIAGGGIEFLRAGGGLIYDSGMGGYNLQESPGVRMAKQLALVAVDAADAVKQLPGHSDFKPTGYSALKDVSQYRLRSDGSR